MSDFTYSRQIIISQLISARLEKGLSQEQLAKLIGTQRSNICRIESGTQNLTVDMLLKITSALGKDVNFSLEERMEPMSNISEERLEAIEKHIEARARELLSLPRMRNSKE